jgi:tight adherence protein C
MAWAAVVLGACWPHRPARRALRRRLPVLPRSHLPARQGIAAVVGRAAVAIVALAVPRWRGPVAARDPTRVGRAVLAAAAAALVQPVLAVPVAALTWAWPALPARRARARRASEVRRHLPEAVDLLALAVGAGLTVPLAVAAVARRAPGPVGRELGQVVAEVGAGRRLGDALALLPARLGEEARPLVAALIASERDGAPLADGLDRLAGELRADRRRRAEEAARRVPVKLLFPLVSCILPAFALLTVAPLLAGALRALRP